jgi:DNA mismatch repair protein MutL
MDATIQPLPREVANRIAAGEVIDSLAAAVRELCENSLDAGARHVQIQVWPELWRVRVADNGRGLSAPDLAQAALAHSTSKIQAEADLWRVDSLGFRGEALHSLAQLGVLEICSRSHRDSNGWQARYNQQGQLTDLSPIAVAPGTVVTVEALFEAWPDRRQVMPSGAQQLRSIQQLIYNLALAHPSVTWQVLQGDRPLSTGTTHRPWFEIAPSTQAAEVLVQILREAAPADLRSQQRTVKTAQGAGCLEVVAGLPDRLHRRRLDWLRIAVNGRVVRIPELEQALLGGYRRTLPRDRYPVAFAHLRLPPACVDWNRHPAKAELYLHDLDFWQEQLRSTVAELLQLGAGPSALGRQASAEVLRLAEAGRQYGSEEPAGVRAIAQLHNTYILVEHPEGLWLVEQHIAHERVLFEQLQDHWQMVPLPQPLVLAGLSEGQAARLTSFGIEIAAFGEGLWAVRNSPALLAKRQDLTDALVELSREPDLPTAQATVACRCAIRNGMPLAAEQQQQILEQWQRCRQPRTCPHGRPISLVLEETSLARFFRRHWMIGKSHGL